LQNNGLVMQCYSPSSEKEQVFEAVDDGAGLPNVDHKKAF